GIDARAAIPSSGSEAPGQRQDDHDDQHDTEYSAGTVAPAPAVGPCRYCAQQQEHQDDQENEGQGHEEASGTMGRNRDSSRHVFPYRRSPVASHVPSVPALPRDDGRLRRCCKLHGKATGACGLHDRGCCAPWPPVLLVDPARCYPWPPNTPITSRSVTVMGKGDKSTKRG